VKHFPRVPSRRVFNAFFKGPAGSAAASPLKPLTNFLGSGLAMQHFVIADLQSSFLVTNREFHGGLSAEEGERDPGRISQNFALGSAGVFTFPHSPNSLQKAPFSCTGLPVHFSPPLKEALRRAIFLL
jgi:hypothetical protein